MRPASHLFYLAVFSLLRSSYGDGQPATKSKSISPDTCAINPSAIVSDACTSYAALESLNTELSPSLGELTQNTDFFAYYRLNLFSKVCPFWNDATSMCGNRACAVDTIEDERKIPPIWRAEELSKLEGARAKHPGPQLQRERPKAKPLQFQLGENVDESCVLETDDECDERDYCLPEDEGATAKGDYVSLVNNTERFTGYSGPGPHQIWDAIYKENCFSKPLPIPKYKSGFFGGLQAMLDLRSVMQEYGRQNIGNEDDLYPLDDECLEQRAFYRIISGMHASISTHICWDYFNQTTGEWVRNLQCYKERLHDHPERVSNLYFNYAVVTRAIAKLRKHLEHYTFCSGDPQQDFETKQKMLELTDRIVASPTTFDESVMFQDPRMLDLKDDFKMRFRNVSRLMDCVGCDKCRLWGKLQTAGYGAALKVLFEFDETKNGENPHLRRTELVALVNTLGRLSHSLTAIQKFRVAVSTGDESILAIQGALSAELETVLAAPRKEESSAEADQEELQSEIESEVIPNSDPPPQVITVVHLETRDEDVPYLPSSPPTSPIDDSDLDDDPYATPRPQSTISEQFWYEFDAVWRAWIYVMKSWINFPFKLSYIVIRELSRLWNYWLGLPVPERSWSLHFPTREEL